MRLAAKKSYPIVTDLKPGNTPPPQESSEKAYDFTRKSPGDCQATNEKTAASHGFPFILLKGLY